MSENPVGPLDAPDHGSLSIFDGEFRAHLEAVGTRRNYSRGEVVIHAGDPSRSVHMVRRGRAKIVRWTMEGNEVVLEEKHPGQLIGEFGALDALPRSASVVAVTKLETTEVAGATFVELLADDHPRAVMPLLLVMARLLRNASETRVVLRSTDVAARIAARLGELAATADDGSSPIRVSCRHEDLAAWTSVNRETATRALGRLRVEGLIRTGRGYVEILDRVGLAVRALQ